MSDNRGEPRGSDDWLDDATAEQLLRGLTDESSTYAATDPADDKRAAALAGLLAAASAPAALDPVREEAAVAAFRAARDEGALTAGVRHRNRRSDDWRPRARGLRHAARSAKAVTGALFATLALGGVAVAAAVGALPTSFGGGAADPDPLRSGGSGSHAGSTTPGQSASPAPDRDRPAGGASRGVDGATPSAPARSTDYQALCRAYAAADWRRGPMDRQSYRELEKAAGGGRHRVRQYCAGLLDSGTGTGTGGGGDGWTDNTGTGGSGTGGPTAEPSGNPDPDGSSTGSSNRGSGDSGDAGSDRSGGIMGDTQ